MTTPFSINCEWLPDDGYTSDQQVLVNMTIKVTGHAVTEVEDALEQRTRPHIRVDAYILAEWFAANWWRLLWEPQTNSYSWRLSHKVGSAGYGYIWPDLSFSSDWQHVRLVARPTLVQPAEPLRYLTNLDAQLPLKDFEEGLTDFMEATLARVTDPQADLRMLWDEIGEERRDPELSRQRILEACMGYDAGEAPQSILDALLDKEPWAGEAAVREVAAAHGTRAAVNISDTQDFARHHGIPVLVPQSLELRHTYVVPDFDVFSADIPDDIPLRHIRLAAINDLPKDVPWIQAANLAHAARQTWGVTIPWTDQKIAELFQVKQETFRGTDSIPTGPSNAGLREGSQPDGFRMTLNKRHPMSRRFHLMRLVAEHIHADEQEGLLPSTDSVTSRQKFQRAFAQELLCPAQDLMEHLRIRPDSQDIQAPTEDDMLEAADRFGVSTVMVQSILIRKGILGPHVI